MFGFAQHLFGLSRGTKRLIQVAFDALAIVFCFWLAMALRLDGNVMAMTARPWLVLIPVIPVTIFAFVMLGLYRAVIRYMADRAVRTVAIGVLISALAMFALSQGLNLRVPRSVPGIYLALLLIVVGGTRFVMRGIYLSTQAATREPVLIYGAGEAGRQVLQALEQSRNYRPALFVDDNGKLSGSEIGGVRIVRPEQARARIKNLGIKTALIAIPDNNPAGRRHAAQVLADLGLEVRVIPNMSDLVSGRVRISELRRITVEELLGREPVPPLPDLMSKTTHAKSVMVTGAGGSIGSELCRQILEQKPSKLVLFENSEFALYRILEDLQAWLAPRDHPTELIPILGSVTHEGRVSRAITENAVETLFHAAAFKHVPLVEANILEGLRNNVFGTKYVAEAAGRLGIKNFTLISTDKAVRPTNVMGATKRVAELVMQATAKAYPDTRFCAVRFGNVLGSSGSVIPKFTDQIRRGGPITLTDPEITRYFMTIPEAAQLVIQANAMAKAGEIYLLDMGEPIKILELARTMARLQGRKTYIAGQEAPIADGLAIEITGLRPGEKLYEELLVDDGAAATAHPRIMLEPAQNAADPSDTLRALAALEAALQAEDAAQALALLRDMPIAYAYPRE
ncbi:polysaccharide biosynthesis protein [Roseobacter sp. HKCCD7870]|uniref:polysaccharide biosynthesis protein n=1 Tax=Roseobacter sp. HKCCD7870 TaxID=3120343 RepID=UPI0030EB7264